MPDDDDLTPVEREELGPAAPPPSRGRRRRDPEPPPPEPPQVDEHEIEQIITAPLIDQPPEGEVNSHLAARVLASDTPEKALSPIVRVPLSELQGKTLALLEYEILTSMFEDTEGIYGLLIMGDMDTGEELAVTTGARHVLAQVAALRRQNALPAVVTVEASTREFSTSGARLWLRAAQPPPA